MFSTTNYATTNYHTIEDEIRSCVRTVLSKSDTIFQALIEVFKTHWERPCTSMLELKKRTAKAKGTAFEVFCVMWIKVKYNTPDKTTDVWMLSEVPEDVLKLLGLTRYDCGIDLIARTVTKGKTLYFPIQCKYRKPTNNKFGKCHSVPWKDVSTFLSLCTRTGVICGEDNRSWTKTIIMTNADSVVWRGHKTKKDYTIAKKTFEGCNKIFWSTFLSGQNGPQVVSELSADVKCVVEDVRNKRQQWLDSLKLKV